MINEIVIKLLLTPFVIFGVVNVLFFFLGIRFSEGHEVSIGDAVLLANFGIYSPRIKFPFADGINSFAMGNSLMFYVSILSAAFFSYKRFFSIFAAFIFFIILLYTDSRSSLFYPVLLFILILILNYFKKYQSIFYCVPFLYLLAPFLLVIIVGLITDLGIGGDISRSDTEAETGNGRFIMWAISLYEFISFKSAHIFGYGLYGHYKSGASTNWALIFPSYKNPDIIHPHNSMISMLFDYGYFGVIIYFTFILNLIKKLIKFSKKYFVQAVFLLGFLFLVVILGMSETIFSTYYSNIMYILFFIYTLIYIIDNLKSNEYI
ncbi:MAG: O-antigen ligase family protein [Bacteroidota bacterium]